MPATFAHPAFAVPFARFGLPISALTLGSMAPDLEYILPFHLKWPAHSIPGIFVFGLPVGLIAWVCFQGLIKPQLYRTAPQPIKVALRQFENRPPWRQIQTWLLVTTAIFLGASTHVGVDAFTHRQGWAVHNFPKLFEFPIFPSPLGQLPLFKVLQYGLGLAGSCLLGIWIWQTYQRGPRLAWTNEDRHRLGCFVLVELGLATLGTIYGFFSARHYEGVQFFKVLAVQSVAATLTLMMASLFIWGAYGSIKKAE